MRTKKVHEIVLDNFELETDADYVMDFAISLGEQLIICGGELWRAEELLNKVFKLYGLHDTSIMMLPNMLIISARKPGHKMITRQRNIGELAVNLEKLTRLKAIVRDLEDLGEERENPEKLMELFNDAMDVQDYPFWVNLAGMSVALLTLVYLFQGTWPEAGVVLGCTIVMQIIRTALGQMRGANSMAANFISAFISGSAAFIMQRFSVPINPYQIMIVCSFAMLPGIPLINSARELLYGRVMSGCFMMLQVFLETMFIVAGFYLSIMLLGGV